MWLSHLTANIISNSNSPWFTNSCYVPHLPSFAKFNSSPSQGNFRTIWAWHTRTWQSYSCKNSRL